MYSFSGSQQTPWTLCECSRRAKTHSPAVSCEQTQIGCSPVDAFHIVAVLSVDPAMKNSPSGDQARS
jgi:hypothetical protein